MKPKHYSLMAAVAVFAIVGLGAWYAVGYQQGKHPETSLKPIPPLPELNVPDQFALQQMDRLSRSLHLLSTPAPRLMSRADLSALGYIPVEPPVPKKGEGRSKGDLASNHRITMAFKGRVNRYCIIDSKLYPEGAVLPDGATIIKIESRRVLIAKERLQQWLTVDPSINTTVSEKRS